MDDAIGHVMMSYQWADQAIVKDIRDILRAEVIIIIIKVLHIKAQGLVPRDYTKWHTHMGDLEWIKTHGTEK